MPVFGDQDIKTLRERYCATAAVTRGLVFFPVSSKGLPSLNASSDTQRDSDELFSSKSSWILSVPCYDRKRIPMTHPYLDPHRSCGGVIETKIYYHTYCDKGLGYI